MCALGSWEVCNRDTWSIGNANRCREGRQQCRSCDWSNCRELRDKTTAVCSTGHGCSEVLLLLLHLYNTLLGLSTYVQCVDVTCYYIYCMWRALSLCICTSVCIGHKEGEMW